jgi:hypothetical protein
LDALPPDTLPHRPTIAAIAVVIYAAGAVIHEGIGHGGACLVTGGRMAGMSGVHFECDGDGIVVAAGGTLMNIVAGLLLFAALRRTPAGRPHLRYALWLGMTVNLMRAAGYFLFSGALGIGDWAEILTALDGGGAARAVLAAAGAVAYLGVVIFAARRLGPFLPGDRATARRVARVLTLVPWIAGGLVSCLSGAFNPVGLVLVAISAAAASFGGTSGLAWMPEIVGTPWSPLAAAGPSPPTLGRHNGWIAAGIVAAIVFVAVLGPGWPRP